MSSEIGGNIATSRLRASAKYASSIFIASSMICSVSGSARADDSATLQKLEAHLQQLEERHESEIKALQAEIKRLRKEKPATTTVAARRPPATEPPPSSILPPGLPPPATPAKVLMTYDRGYHFGFSDATGENTVELFGRLQLDTGGYTNYNPGPETLDRKGLSDGVDLRRARIGVIGTFMSDWHYAFVYDFGNSSDSSNIDNALASANSSTSPTTSNSFLSGVENAFITYNGFYSHGQQFPVAFDFGPFPGDPDEESTAGATASANPRTAKRRDLTAASSPPRRPSSRTPAAPAR